MNPRNAVLLLASVFLLACGDSSGSGINGDGGADTSVSGDAGSADSGVAWDTGADGGALHDGGADTSPPGDDGATDSGGIEARPAETSTPDASTRDASTPDTGAPDASTSDTGALDTGALDTGALDTGAPDTGPRDTCYAHCDAAYPNGGGAASLELSACFTTSACFSLCTGADTPYPPCLSCGIAQFKTSTCGAMCKQDPLCNAYVDCLSACP